MVVLNIDTSKDSKEEIRKTIAYLQSLIGEETGGSFTNPATSEPAGSLLGMFDAPESATGVSDSEQAAHDDDFISVDTADDEVEVVDDQADTVIEIVEY